MNIYQEFCRTTAIYPKAVEREYLVAGLCSEAGEVAGKFAKMVRDTDMGVTNTVDAMQALEVAKELSDCMWFIARLSDYIGWDLQDIVELNILKLTERQERGTIGGSGDNR